jgi:predicted N-acetyltransferase YhbS
MSVGLHTSGPMMQIEIGDAAPADADAIAGIGREAFERAFRGLVPDQCLTGLTLEESAANWQRTLRPGGLDEGEFVLVAQDEAGRVVGCAMAHRRPDDPIYRAELNVLFVSASHQRQGIGRRLVREVAQRMAAAEIHSLLVRVLANNPNRPFYERMGAEYLREQPYDWEGVILPEAVYGWKDTAPLITEGADAGEAHRAEPGAQEGYPRRLR